MSIKEEFSLTDHDLLVRLHERFSNFEKLIISSIDGVNNRVGQVMSDVDSKTDFKDFVANKEKTNEKIHSIDKRLKKVEDLNKEENIKKGVYINMAAWTWKNWAQLIGIILLIISFLDNITK